MNETKINQLLGEINSIKDKGHVVLIKFDGERQKDKITGVITFPKNPSNEVIQFHGDDLEEVLSYIIKKFNSL